MAVTDEKDDNGLHLVRTRVLIRFTKLFWKDLGLAYVHERVQKSAKKRRDAQLRDIGQQRLADMEKHSLELQRRETSRQRWQAKENREAGVAGTQGAASPSTSPPVSNTVSSALDRLLASRSKKA
ncbi:hypothetical protein MDO45_29320 (plasmid) [Pseudomonas amygdali pv. aesculi]|nr:MULTISPECIES: hypothetical protein [Pseudomonas syringae group genomosp. 2]MCQ3013609.1 hypothetical protein [Pseudomonas savastanoi]UNO28974.1 hypothetical protein MDO45_29320 [Pseudomonas amygdali pv. aesculi]WGQ03758.1 hypothetical protein QFG70_28730 [Pseudomonas amygdali pv. aesculi]